MKVMVFGGSGFIGSHVADALSEAGHNVGIYDLQPSPYMRDDQEMILGDILDIKSVEKAVEGYDCVYNFAGVSDIDEARNNPLECIHMNILGNSIVLEASRKAKVRRFIFASTLYVYSRAGSFYRSTKQANELIIENFHELYGLPYTILRYGSLYGPRAKDNNYICSVIKQALGTGRIVREGDGNEIREYIHVFDAARCSVEILEEEFANQYVIISGNQQMKVRDLFIMINEILDNKIKVEYRPAKANHHYKITPYSFAPKMAKKFISKTYMDLGQGVLNYIQDMYTQLNPPPTLDGLVARKID